jgi:hypothetical protein
MSAHPAAQIGPNGGFLGMKRIFIILAASVASGLLAMATASAAGAGGSGAVLNWVAPRKNTDGSALTDLLGFNVYHGTNPGSMMLAASLTSATTSFTDSNLTPSVWYWYVTTVDLLGIESAPSATVSKTITAVAGSAAAGSAAAGSAAAGNTAAGNTAAGNTAAGNTAAGNPSASNSAATPATTGDQERQWDLSRIAAQRHSICRPRGDVWCFRP